MCVCFFLGTKKGDNQVTSELITPEQSSPTCPCRSTCVTGKCPDPQKPDRSCSDHRPPVQGICGQKSLPGPLRTPRSESMPGNHPSQSHSLGYSFFSIPGKQKSHQHLHAANDGRLTTSRGNLLHCWTAAFIPSTDPKSPFLKL